MRARIYLAICEHKFLFFLIPEPEAFNLKLIIPILEYSYIYGARMYTHVRTCGRMNARSEVVVLRSSSSL